MTDKPLSPAAASASDAALQVYALETFTTGERHAQAIAAAALRAAADAVVPLGDANRSPCREHCLIGESAGRIRQALLAIADELDAGDE